MVALGAQRAQARVRPGEALRFRVAFRGAWWERWRHPTLRICSSCVSCLHSERRPHAPLLLPQLRVQVWPLLLGVPGAAGPEQEDYAALATREHKDSTVVDCDVARSLWSLTRGPPPRSHHFGGCSWLPMLDRCDF